ADHQQSLLAALAGARAQLGDQPGAIDVTLNATQTPPAGSTLFVIARPPGGGMPYAVVRRPAHPLPPKVRLDDLVSMNPALPISAAGTVEIVARISFSGAPTSHPGDWEWRSEPFSPGQSGSMEPIQLNATLAPPES
ncbi:MAG: hypothetical protein O3A63_20585, partial [Proteobacteria bacterium]|nr:hypothetical protein [Pseudomonadota bacterium]